MKAQWQLPLSVRSLDGVRPYVVGSDGDHMCAMNAPMTTAHAQDIVDRINALGAGAPLPQLTAPWDLPLSFIAKGWRHWVKEADDDTVFVVYSPFGVDHAQDVVDAINA